MIEFTWNLFSHRALSLICWRCRAEYPPPVQCQDTKINLSLSLLSSVFRFNPGKAVLKGLQHSPLPAVRPTDSEDCGTQSYWCHSVGTCQKVFSSGKLNEDFSKWHFFSPVNLQPPLYQPSVSFLPSSFMQLLPTHFPVSHYFDQNLVTWYHVMSSHNG